MNDTTQIARQLARSISEWNIDLATLARTTPIPAIDEALASYQRAMIPMCNRTEAENQPDQIELAKLIRDIGARIRPDFTEDQARLWCAAMVNALDEFPARIVLQAAREARHDEIEFPGQVHKAIKIRADRLLASGQSRIARLKRMRRIAEQPLALEASPEAKQLAEKIELEEMAPEFRSLGIAAGWLIEDHDGIRWATDAECLAHEGRIARARAKAGRP